jgi:hypothetical protein
MLGDNDIDVFSSDIIMIVVGLNLTRPYLGWTFDFSNLFLFSMILLLLLLWRFHSHQFAATGLVGLRQSGNARLLGRLL